MRLEGKVALISGGARGMGAEEALLFAREGAKVVIADVLEAEGRALAASIPGGQAIFVRLDVTKEADWQRAVGLAEEIYKRLDILVNNAGVSAVGGIEDTTEEEWDRGDVGQRQGGVSRHEIRHPSHAAGRWRLHHQHLVAVGHRGDERV